MRCSGASRARRAILPYVRFAHASVPQQGRIDYWMNEDVTGRDWTESEIDAAVASYFAMLSDDIAGRSFNKAE